MIYVCYLSADNYLTLFALGMSSEKVFNGNIYLKH